MGSVPATTDNVVPFRRTVRPRQAAASEAASRGGIAARRSEQRALMDSVYATGSLSVAAGDRETKLVAARLQVYGFVRIEEVAEDGSARRLRPSEAIRAGTGSPWRLSKASYGTATGLAVTIPAIDGFLFDQPAGRPA